MSANLIMSVVFAGLMLASCGESAQGYGVVEATSSNEISERQAIFDSVETAVRARDFARLNAMAEDMRSRRARTPSGVWRLAYFYHGLDAAVAPAGRCSPMNTQFFADWIAVDPAQPAAHIALASAHNRRAWCARGSGFANAVSPQDAAFFAQTIADAIAELQSHHDIASRDPQYYQMVIAMVATQPVFRGEFEDLVEEAIDAHPYYYGIYFAASTYYLPQWNGRDGDIDRLADWAVDATEARDGSGAYARVMWHLEQMEALDLTAVDWSQMDASMQELAAQYPNRWNLTNFARLSCRLEQPEAAARFFGMIVGDDDTNAWPTAAERTACRRMAGVEAWPS